MKINEAKGFKRDLPNQNKLQKISKKYNKSELNRYKPSNLEKIDNNESNQLHENYIKKVKKIQN